MRIKRNQFGEINSRKRHNGAFGKPKWLRESKEIKKHEIPKSVVKALNKPKTFLDKLGNAIFKRKKGKSNVKRQKRTNNSSSI